MKHIGLLILLFFLSIGAAGATDLTVLYTGDTAGYVLPCG